MIVDTEFAADATPAITTTTTDSPGDFPDDEELDEEAFADRGIIPWMDTDDTVIVSSFIEYSDRGPRDVVVSGPITGGWGPGRWHKNRRIAYWRVVGKYGPDRVKPMPQSNGRWSFLIKNLRSE